MCSIGRRLARRISKQKMMGLGLGFISLGFRVYLGQVLKHRLPAACQRMVGAQRGSHAGVEANGLHQIQLGSLRVCIGLRLRAVANLMAKAT